MYMRIRRFFCRIPACIARKCGFVGRLLLTYAAQNAKINLHSADRAKYAVHAPKSRSPKHIAHGRRGCRSAFEK